MLCSYLQVDCKDFSDEDSCSCIDRLIDARKYKYFLLNYVLNKRLLISHFKSNYVNLNKSFVEVIRLYSYNQWS